MRSVVTPARQARRLVAAVTAFWLLADCSASRGAPPGPGGPGPDFAALRRQAADLAGRPYVPPDANVPEALSEMDYENYVAIRHREEDMLWAGEDLPFRVGFYPRGYNFLRRVEIYVLEAGRAEPVSYSEDQFVLPPGAPGELFRGDLGFAGLRVQYRFPESRRYEEIASFLGGCYFRGKGSSPQYGTSGRGVCIDTGTAHEEFPHFTRFWITRPSPEDRTISLLALMDGPSITGACRFEIRPGERTVMDIEAELLLRKDVGLLGLAPLTSMFLFDQPDARFPDTRGLKVHDSDGLYLWPGTGERLWRPLRNPLTQSMSAFETTGLEGFGLLQRERDPGRYRGESAEYATRPNVWIRPAQPWQNGVVRLVEWPSEGEGQDNITAFWQPTQPARAGESFYVRYSVEFGPDVPAEQPGGRVVATRWKSQPDGRARFEVDFALPGLRSGVREGILAPADFALLQASSEPPQPVLTTANGSAGPAEIVPGRTEGEWRVTFEASPDAGKTMELRLFLRGIDGQALTETWSYPWPR